MAKKTHYISVIGAGECSPACYEQAEEVGYSMGRNGWILVCGGLGGVMEAAAKGCAMAKGLSVGILPGFDRQAANPYVDIPLPTGLGEGRNLLVVRAADLLIAISGGHGTLSEIALALKAGKPVIGLNTWPGIEGVRYVGSPLEAIEEARLLLKE